MPKPNLLPAIDWRSVFDSGAPYATWLAEGETEKNRDAMIAADTELVLDPKATVFLGALGRNVYVIAIAEDWCPDVVRHVPVLEKMTAATPNLNVRYISRESNPEVLTRHLTVGGEAIPKFIFFNHEFVECGSWGPMPHACREIIARGRAAADLKTARQNVSQIYDADQTRSIVFDELIRLVDVAATSMV